MVVIVAVVAFQHGIEMADLIDVVAAAAVLLNSQCSKVVADCC